MNFSYLKMHLKLFLVLFIVVSSTLAFTLIHGEAKPENTTDWYDIAGEAGITIMTLIWLFFTLASRPAGKVTYLLFAGLLLTHISMLLDLIDEFLVYPESSAWLTTIESLPAPIGMIFMTIGLYRWHQEQHVINQQLRKTERYYRQHSYIDFTTGLYSAEYMKMQLQSELNHVKSSQGVFSLLLLDIRQFSQFNHNFGTEQGDNLLREVAQLIQMNIRNDDIACRFASDRFIVLLPHTPLAESLTIAQHIKTAISHLAHKSDETTKAIYPSITTLAKEYRGWHEYQAILTELNQSLNQQKRQSETSVA